MISAQTNHDVDPSLVARILNVEHLRMEGEGDYTLTILKGECTEEQLQTAIQQAWDQQQQEVVEDVVQ